MPQLPSLLASLATPGSDLEVLVLFQVPDCLAETARKDDNACRNRMAANNGEKEEKRQKRSRLTKRQKDERKKHQ